MKRAAANGDPAAIMGIATFYREGVGCTASRAEALKWYARLPVNAGPWFDDRERALWEMEIFGAPGEPLGASLQRLKAAAAKGDPDAMVRVGRYTLGPDRRNWDDALHYFLPAARRGHAEAMRWVGQRFMRPPNVPLGRNPVYNTGTAIKWLERAAAAGDKEAATLLIQARKCREADNAPSAHPPKELFRRWTFRDGTTRHGVFRRERAGIIHAETWDKGMRNIRFPRDALSPADTEYVDAVAALQRAYATDRKEWPVSLVNGTDGPITVTAQIPGRNPPSQTVTLDAGARADLKPLSSRKLILTLIEGGTGDPMAAWQRGRQSGQWFRTLSMPSVLFIWRSREGWQISEAPDLDR
jgi:hypothetical protein